MLDGPDDAVAPSALAVHPDGTSERAEFIGEPGNRFLAFAHQPAKRPTATLVICGSPYDDGLLSYRIEVLLARRLAARGVLAARLHYRGTGNSDDLPDRATTVGTMTADVRALLDSLPAAGAVFVMGVRFGALVAAAVAHELPAARLIFWEPLITGRDYFRDMFRAARFAAVRSARGDVAASVKDVLIEKGWVEVMAHRVELASYEDAVARTLRTELPAGREICLVTHAARERSAGRRFDVLEEQLQADGHGVDRIVIDRMNSWWLVPDPDAWVSQDTQPDTADLLAGVSGWVVSKADS